MVANRARQRAPVALFDAGRWSAVAEITFRACAGSVGALVPACDPALDFFQDLVN
jgi:hypothetical protein